MLKKNIDKVIGIRLYNAASGDKQMLAIDCDPMKKPLHRSFF